LFGCLTALSTFCLRSDGRTFFLKASFRSSLF
jgi:hypothetical protein